jgi:UDP-N-acetylmuramate dehydrogenase
MRQGVKVTPAPELSRLSTIRLGGRAIAEVMLANRDALEAVPEVLKTLGGRPVVLGQGSNILPKDGALPLTLLRLDKNFTPDESRNGEKLKKLDEDSQGAVFWASAALPLPVLVKEVCQAGFAGFSGLAGIPGSVGGAVAMNAGSFAMDMRGVLRRVNMYVLHRGLVSLPAEKLDLGYRRFTVPGLERQAAEENSRFIILSAEFYCPRGQSAALLRETEQFMERKQSTQPVKALSAGCVFKNPAQAPAGQLLEETGLKGKRRGGMMFSGLHANFLVNTGRGTATEALELIAEAQEKVWRRHGVKLELEVQVWG